MANGYVWHFANVFCYYYGIGDCFIRTIDTKFKLHLEAYDTNS